MAMATGRECMNLERFKIFKSQQQPPLLQTTSIKEMFENGLISSSTKEECRQLKDKATRDETTCVYPFFFEEHGYSGCIVYLYVYTAKVDRWCSFGRTRVTLDTVTGKLTCRCKGNKKRMCVHIYVSMCWTFQEKQHLLRVNMDKDIDFTDTDNDSLTEDTEPGLFQRNDHITSVQIRNIAEYMWKSKRMPPKLPEEMQNTAPNIPQKFSQEETKCPYCPGPTPPDLSQEKQVTKKGIIYGILTVHKDLSA
ncbi:hypothetical protein F2P81_003910 [Scophthalmus maximus]|uniref:SWIM-type domain-containing protein n=1 Tax=Scophthalmus maximus TaxID=52904 RepID=A0A6A4TRT6_SCOMX|nr:hypothetical protein F2P81_003910 [Scophthalmus maximus]